MTTFPQVFKHIKATGDLETQGNAHVYGTIGYRKLTSSLTSATKSITAAESGTLFFLNRAGGIQIKLPTPENGLFYEFYVATAPTTAYTITSTSNGDTASDKIHGNQVVSENGTTADSTNGTAVDVISFVANQASVGDYVQVVCDGTLWYAYATTRLVAGLTYA
jgi:hypothetical protein